MTRTETRNTQRATDRIRWRKPVGAGVLGLVGLIGCSEANVTEPASVQAAEIRPVIATAVNLPILVVDAGFSRDAEFRGLMTAAVELGLSDMPGVVPVLPGDSAPPSLLLSRPVVRRTVDASFIARGTAESLVLELELCVPGGSCDAISAPGTAKAPWEAVGVLLEGAAEVLGVEVSEATRLAWRTPGSKDNYSELITGRACAQLYGILPPSDQPGDKKADPVLKALYLDPGQPIAHWVRARWEMATTLDGGKAGESLAKAQLLRPTSPVFVADQATMAGLVAKPAESLLGWETIVATTGDDPRWLDPLARAYLAVDRPEDALRVLARMPGETGWDPQVAALRVVATEAAGGIDLDPLLERWQAVASGLSAPVERRIGLRVQRGEYADALGLVGALRDRVAGPSTDALEVALLLTLGRTEEAAALAPPDVASQILARRALELGAALPEGLALPPTDVALLRANASLARGDAATTLAATDEILGERPKSVEGWTLRARALALIGRADEAAESFTTAWDTDPAADGGPVTPGRIASTFRYVETGTIAGVDDVGVEPGPKGPEL